jgi:DNA ligase (NAD+)
VEFIQWLEKQDFHTCSRKAHKWIKSSGCGKEIEAKRKAFSFETDGAVIKVNDFGLQKQLGIKTREPRWAIAYKFAAHQGTTRILDIQGSVGRTGVITPFAIFEPVRIGGVTVSRSTLHNWDEMERKDIRIGDTVVVERAGDVIPHVVAVIKEKRTGKERPFPVPDKCPACGSKVVREEGEVAVQMYRTELSCAGSGEIIHLPQGSHGHRGSRREECGTLHSKGLINHFADIYKLKKEDLLKLPSSPRNHRRTLSTPSKKQAHYPGEIPLCLGILHVGEYTSKLLAKNFENLEDLYHMTPERILRIRQMGEKIAHSVSDFFNDRKNLQTLDELRKLGLKLTNPDFEGKENRKRPFENLTFVITGTLPKPRDEVERLIESLGGRVSSSVSENTDYVIVGENPGSKLQKSQTLGIKAVSYEELMKLVGKSRDTEAGTKKLF